MKIKDLVGKKIIFLGLGMENASLLRFLLRKEIEADMVIADPQPEKKLIARLSPLFKLAEEKNIKLEFRSGRSYDWYLGDFNLVFRSPGYPLFSPSLKSAQKKGTEVSSPMKLFFSLSPTSNLIGVTGTKGKGTTSSLIYEILQRAGKEVWLGGNIGIPPFDFLEEIKRNSWVVLELSSFQLEDMTQSPKIAVITNLYKEHLRASDPHNHNYHKKLKDYWKAKLNILKYQKKGDKAIVNKNIERFVSAYNPLGKLITFSRLDWESKLFGEHNQENVAAAYEAARALNIKKETIKKAIKNYQPLEHRLELVLEDKNKVKYFNDSFATTPEATMTALKAFTSPIILLAGGAEKNSDFKELAKFIKEKVKFLILFSGQASPRLRKEVKNSGFSASKIKTAYNMKEAVKLARKKRSYGDIVLLSPACASFGLFKNYKQRGELFKKEVKKQPAVRRVVGRQARRPLVFKKRH